MVLVSTSSLMLWTSIHSSLCILSTRFNSLNLLITSIVSSYGISFKSYMNGLMVFPTFFSLSLNFPSLVAQRVKHLLAMRETQVQSLGREDPLEKEMSTHFNIPIWRTPWTIAYQAPLSMEFSRQEYWSGRHSLFQGIFPTQGLNLGLPHCGQILYHWATREALVSRKYVQIF